MIRKVGIICIVGAALSVIYGMRSPAATRPRGSISSGKAAEPNFRKILLGSRATPPATASSSDPACHGLWEGIRSVDLQRLNEEVFRGCILLPKTEVCAHPPAQLVSAQSAYAKACSVFMDPGVEKASVPALDQRAQECFLSLVAYRSAVGNWLTLGQPLSQIEDIQVLGDKLLHEMFSSLRGEETSVETVKAVAERVNELNPEVYSTSKIVAVSDLMDAMGRPSRERWEKARRALEKLERFESDDPDQQKLSLWIRTEGMRPEKLREEAGIMVKDRPNSGLGYFYLAFAEAGLGNREKVGALFMSAVQAEPNNPTFVRALENFRANRPVPPPFKFDFNLGVNELMERG